MVKEGIEDAFIQGHDAVTTKDFVEAIDSTHPLKEIMGDSIEKLEKEYKERKFKSAS